MPCMRIAVQEAVVNLLDYRGQKLKGVVLKRTEKNAHARKAIVAACKEIKKESLIRKSETV